MVDVQTLIGYMTPISLTIGVFYYIMSLRNQNRARQTQLIMQINDAYRDPNQLEARNKFSTYDWSTPEEFLEDLSSLEGRLTIGTLGTYYEGLGVLVREKLLDIRVVALLMTGNILNFWNKLKPLISEAREIAWGPRLFSETEYLYNELMKYLEKHPELKS